MATEQTFDLSGIIQQVKDIEKALVKTFNIVESGNRVSKDSFDKLGKSINDAFKDGAGASEEALKGIEQGVKDLARNTIDSAQSIETSFTQAFSKISVLKSSVDGIGSFFGGLMQAPMQMEKAMAQLSFVSKDVKNKNLFLEMSCIMFIIFFRLKNIIICCNLDK